MDNIIQWPIKFDHQHEHKRLFDTFTETLIDYQRYIIENQIDTEMIEPGQVDFSKISVADLHKWVLINASQVSHNHN